MELVAGTAGFGDAGAGSAWMMPGKRKSSGETVRDALTPPHPAASSGNAANGAKSNNLQLILTCRV